MTAVFCCIYILSGSVASDRRRIVAMDERMVDAIVRRAGLERALAEFPDDVAAAAVSAAKATEGVRRSSGMPLEPLSEPWPPMVVVRK
jgi:hypothetical protein